MYTLYCYYVLAGPRKMEEGERKKNRDRRSAVRPALRIISSQYQLASSSLLLSSSEASAVASRCHRRKRRTLIPRWAKKYKKPAIVVVNIYIYTRNFAAAAVIVD